MNRRVAVRGIVVHKGKLLCFKLKPYEGSTARSDFWCVPGGGVDQGEPLLEALRREMIEETGIEPEIGNLLYIQQFTPWNKPDAEHLEFFFHVKNAKDYLKMDLSKTTHGHLEIEKHDFIDPAKNHIKPTFLSEESLDNLENQPAKVFSYL